MGINVPEIVTGASAAERAVERSLSRRRATYADEIERLVSAAFELIRERGELEPRVGEIVAAAGSSNQAFYKHFRSKHELLVAVLDAGIERLAAYLVHRMEGAGDPVTAIREWLRGMLLQALDPDAAEATRPFALARGRLAEAFPAEVARSERRLTEPLRDAIAAARAQDRVVSSEPGQDAEALYHLAMGWLEARLLEEAEPDEAHAQRLEAFALAGLGVGAARGGSDGA